MAVTDKIVDLLEAKLGGAAATFGACHMRMERDMCFAGPGNKCVRKRGPPSTHVLTRILPLAVPSDASSLAWACTKSGSKPVASHHISWRSASFSKVLYQPRKAPSSYSFTPLSVVAGLASPGDALYVASGNEVLTSTWFKTWRKVGGQRRVCCNVLRCPHPPDTHNTHVQSSSFKVFTKLDVACPVSMPEEEAFESTSCVTL